MLATVPQHLSWNCPQLGLIWYCESASLFTFHTYTEIDFTCMWRTPWARFCAMQLGWAAKRQQKLPNKGRKWWRVVSSVTNSIRKIRNEAETGFDMNGRWFVKGRELIYCLLTLQLAQMPQFVASLFPSLTLRGSCVHTMTDFLCESNDWIYYSYWQTSQKFLRLLR